MIFSIFSVIVVVLISGFIGIQSYQAKNHLKPMAGMMITMSIAMMVPLTIGITLGMQLTDYPTLATIYAIFLGILIGCMIGHPFGIIAQLEGTMAGVMGGLMGPMTGLMITNQNPHLFIGFFQLVFVLIMFMIYKLIRQSVPQQENNGMNQVWWIFPPICLLLILFSLYQSGFQPQLQANSFSLGIQKKDHQEGTIHVTTTGYSPQRIFFKQGVPVTLHFHKNDSGGCLSYLLIPSFNIQQELQQGDNLIKFTPKKKGTFTYTCGMGMYHGYIIIK